MNKSNEQIQRIASETESRDRYNVWVNSFIEAAKATIVPEPLKHTLKNCNSLAGKRTAKMYEDIENGLRSEVKDGDKNKIYTCRMFLGTLDDAYLQSGVATLWCGNLERMQDKTLLYPSSISSDSEVTQMAMRSVLTAIRKQAEEAERDRNRSTHEAAVVIAYLLQYPDIRVYVQEIANKVIENVNATTSTTDSQEFDMRKQLSYSTLREFATRYEADAGVRDIIHNTEGIKYKESNQVQILLKDIKNYSVLQTIAEIILNLFWKENEKTKSFIDVANDLPMTLYTKMVMEHPLYKAYLTNILPADQVDLAEHIKQYLGDDYISVLPTAEIDGGGDRSLRPSVGNVAVNAAIATGFVCMEPPQKRNDHMTLLDIDEEQQRVATNNIGGKCTPTLQPIFLYTLNRQQIEESLKNDIVDTLKKTYHCDGNAKIVRWEITEKSKNYTKTQKKVTTSTINASIASCGLQAIAAAKSRTQATDTDGVGIKSAIIAALNISLLSPLSLCVQNPVGPAEQNTAWTGAEFGYSKTTHCIFPGIVHNCDKYNIDEAKFQTNSNVEMRFPEFPPGPITPVDNSTDDSTTASKQEKLPQKFTTDTICHVLTSMINANQTKQSIDETLKTTSIGLKQIADGSIKGEPKDFDERTRRNAIWDDALRELFVSGDRLYSFLKTMAGATHDDVTNILRFEDNSMDANQRANREQRKELLKSVSNTSQKIMDALMSNIFKQSKLKVDLDMSGNMSPEAIASNLGQTIVVLSDDAMDQVRHIASGDSGLPFFQANVDIERALKKTQSGGIELRSLVMEMRKIIEEYRQSALESLEGEQVSGIRSSLEYLAEPRNSFVIKLKNETYAAIRASFDMVHTELYGRFASMGSGNGRVTAWEMVEGPDSRLTNQFAELCALQMSHSRLFSSSSSVYIGAMPAKANILQLRTALQKTVRRAQEYRAAYPSQLPTAHILRKKPNV